MKKERIEWVDVAKGISILLVVLWHSKINGESVLINYINSINEGLIFLRMPLFFFVSGFFIKKSLNRDWDWFLKFRIVNLIYLFLLWSIINDLIFYTIPSLIKIQGLQIINPLSYFVDPPATLWFIYALAIGFTMMKLTKDISIWIMLPFFLIIYGVYSSDGQWRNVDFIIRVARLIPFMYLGSISFNFISQKIEKWHIYFMPIIIFLPFAYKWLMESSYVSNPLLTLIASLLGLIILLSVSYAISGSFLGQMFKMAGASSLYIYVMHRIPIQLSKYFFNNLIPFQINPLIIFLCVFIIAVSIPLLIRKYFIRGKVIYFFRQPFFREQISSMEKKKAVY